MIADEPVDDRGTPQDAASRPEDDEEPPSSAAVATILLVALGVVPIVAGVLGAATLMAELRLASEFWMTVAYLVGGLVIAAGLKAAHVGYLFAGDLLRPRSPRMAAPIAALAAVLAVTGGVESFLSVYSGPTPWVWLVAAGPAAAGAVAALAVAVTPGPS